MGSKGTIAWPLLRAPQNTAPAIEVCGESRNIPGIAIHFPHFFACRGFGKGNADSDFGDLQHRAGDCELWPLDMCVTEADAWSWSSSV